MAHSVASPIVNERINERRSFPQAGMKNEAYSSGVSWAAVIAGAVGAAALSLILIALGTGFGLSATSPWSNVGASASRVGVGAIIWLIIVQIIAFGLSGYLAGRLRTKWVDIHTNEVYFRDTAHGFLVWAVGVVITAAFLASATMSMVGHAQPTGGATSTQADQSVLDPNAYFVDMLLRSNQPNPDRNDAAVRAEIARILDRSLQQGDGSATDQNYLAQVVAARTGLTRSEAERRVSDVLTQARQAADSTRKAVAHSLYWTFLALLIGAFCASYAATIGGRQRDEMVV
jgi:heme/copper-type cytochrome/quinol oxidase subunit 2